MGEHSVQETLSYPSRLLTENPTLRNGSGEAWSGACPLWHAQQGQAVTQVQWQLASLNRVVALITDATEDGVFLTDPINTASGAWYVAFYLATAFFSITIVRED